MLRSTAPTLLLVTPYLAQANNGNWRTAARWARLLASRYRVIVQAATDPVTGGRRDDAVAMIALHARRSAPAIAGWHSARAERALIVTLTGTDLYRDLPAKDAATLASLEVADQLIVLQQDAVRHLPRSHRGKAAVVFQSARALVRWTGKDRKQLHCVLVAHLREEKDPRTALAAWRHLPPDLMASLTVIGDALDPALELATRETVAADPRVRSIGKQPHAATRQAIKRAHLLLVPSRMEGGANVVVEAVTAGTPILASRISGNLGMLGADYAGYFDVGDAGALAQLVARAAREPKFLRELSTQCRRRAKLFTPAAEAHSLHAAITAALNAGGARMSHSRLMQNRQFR